LNIIAQDQESPRDEQLHKAQNTLREIERKYQHLFEGAGDSIFIVDVQTLKIVDANTHAGRRLGYTREELLQLRLDQIEILMDQEEDPLAWESSASGTLVYECKYRRKDGYEIPVEVSSRIGTQGGSKVTINFVRDITERKRAEKARREENARLSILHMMDEELNKQLSTHHVAMISLDSAIRLSDADAGYIGLWQEDHLEIVAMSGPYPEDFTRSGRIIDTGIGARALHLQAPQYVLNVHDDADYVPLLPQTSAQICIPMLSPQQPVGLLVLEASMAEQFDEKKFKFLKLLGNRIATALDNAQLFEESQRMIEDLEAFSHTVAHDLKGPLSVIAGYVSLFDDEEMTLNGHEIRRAMDAVGNNAHKMISIVDELLLLASVREMSQIAINRLNMGEIVAGAIERLSSLIEKHDAEIELPDNWPDALGYGPWIEEVWVNYISNAIKYGGSPPRVKLGARPLPDGNVRFWVQDNGIGIAPEDQEKLFKTFTRLDEVRRIEGHGLGLSIVKRIMRKLGGEVGVVSEIGKGSTFSFTLPKYKKA
jgi:PAS domain S-box-containing protein